MTLTNWARTVRWDPARVETPRNEEEVVALVERARREGRRVKPYGAAHSWSDVAATDGIAMSLDRMRAVVRSAREGSRGAITVQGGIRLRELNAQLAWRGMAMTILGSVAEQSIAGATATGTHGSSLRHPNISAFVTGLRLVTGRGDVLALREDDPPSAGAKAVPLAAARLGLGALGIVTEVTLRCERDFRLAEATEPVALDEALERLPEIAASAEYVKLWWLPGIDVAQVFRCTRTEDRPTVTEVGRWIDERVINRVLFRGLLRLGERWPAITPPVNRAVSRLYFKAARRVGVSYRILGVAMPPLHREMEYGVALADAPAVLRELARTIAARGWRINFVVEVRFARADDAWMSPAHGRESCHIGAYQGQSPDLEPYFDTFQRILLEHGGRPHWGKEHAVPPDRLRRAFPRYDAFCALREVLDPDGIFRNAFVDRTFGLG